VATLAHAASERPLEFRLGLGGTAGTSRHGASDGTQRGASSEAAAAATQDTANGRAARGADKTTRHGAVRRLFPDRTRGPHGE